MRKFILRYFDVIRVLLSITIGLLLAFLVMFLVSEDPILSIRSLLVGPFASRGRFSNIFETATPLIFCGLAASIPFQAKQFWVGAEGSLYFGGALGTAFALSTKLPPGLHHLVLLGFVFFVGMATGIIPAILKVYLKINEFVVSLMLNYIFYFSGLYLINFHFRDKQAGYLVSYALPATTLLSKLIPKTRIHLGIIFALLAAFLVYLFIFHTKWGYEIRMVGANLNFAKYGGINIKRVIILSIVLGGGIAALGGIIEVMGIHGRFNWQTSPGIGWNGIMAAIIAGNHPLLIIVTSLFISYLITGAQVVNLMSDIPAEMITVIQAIIILLVTSQAFLEFWRHRMLLKEAEKNGSNN